MAIDFPNSPSVGDVYVAGNISRKWDGTTWSIIPTTITGATGAPGPDILSATSPVIWNSTSRDISITTIPITSGGTGQTTANAALNAFLPTQTSNSGKFLTTDGSNTSWGSAAVSVTNDTTTATSLYPLFTASTSGTITAANVTSSKLTFVPSTGLLTVTGLTVTNTITGSISGNAGTVTNGVYTTTTSLPNVTSVNGTTIPSAATLLTTTSTSSALTSFGTSPVLTTPKIDIINTNTGAATAATLWSDITTGSIGIGGALTGNLTLAGAVGFAGTVAIANSSTSAHGVNISGGAGTTNKTINIGTGSTGGTTAVTIGSSSGATSTVTLNGTVSTSGNLTVGGNLTVNGGITTINSTTITVDDIVLELGAVTTPTDTTANGGGISLLGTTNKTILWDSTNTNWTSSEHWNIASGKVFKIANTQVLSNTAVLGLTPTTNATGFTLSGGTTAVAVTFAGGAAYTLSGTNGQTYTFPSTGGTLLSTTTGVTTFSGGSTGLTPATATSGAITLAGTLAVANGGTGVTTSTGTGSVVLGTSPTITTPQLSIETTSRTTDGSISWDSTNDYLRVGNGTVAKSFFPFDVNTTAKTGAYTLATGDYNTLVQMNAAAAFTVGTGLSGAPVGTQIHLFALVAGVSVTASSTTVYATPGLKLRAQYSMATLICVGTNTWILTGDITA